jgi:2-C-methyl-D-erythritol 4-phosphate cytidylyltransferase
MNIAILLAGGKGSRLGQDAPKQFLEISGRMMIMYSFEALASSRFVDDVIIVAEESYRNMIEDAVTSEDNNDKLLGFADPGENRQLSIYNGLKEIENMGLSDSCDLVIVQDSARPFCSTQLIEECLTASDGHDGAMPVLPMNDTVYFSKDGKKVDELLDRNTIYAGQAPEVFGYSRYYEANKALLPDKILHIKGSSETAVLAGMDIAMIPGDQRNFKVTTREDFERAVEILGLCT